MSERVRIAIVGAGPAGLTAAAALARRVGRGVVVLEREAEPGGIPRHSAHPGFGLRDLHRSLSGPEYARRLADRAVAEGAEIRTRSTVTGWDGVHALETTSPAGRLTLEADAVVLATGARERPRAARLLPGARVEGVLTTGHLQQLVHLHGSRSDTTTAGRVGRSAVVVGAELVSWSAVTTLRHAGCDTVLMTTTHHRPESYAAFNAVGRLALRVPVATRTRVVRIDGTERVRSVEVEHLDTGERRTIACDTVVTTGDWIPDHELVRLAGIELDPHTLGPVVDTTLHTSTPGVFAAGNLLHPVDTADVAALDGRHLAEHVLAWLEHPARRPPRPVRLEVEPPLRWISPQLIDPGGPPPPRSRYLAWTDRFVAAPRVEVRQHETLLASRRLPWPANPGRVFRIPASLFRQVQPDGGPVTIHIC